MPFLCASTKYSFSGCALQLFLLFTALAEAGGTRHLEPSPQALMTSLTPAEPALLQPQVSSRNTSGTPGHHSALQPLLSFKSRTGL